MTKKFFRAFGIIALLCAVVFALGNYEVPEQATHQLGYLRGSGGEVVAIAYPLASDLTDDATRQKVSRDLANLLTALVSAGYYGSPDGWLYKSLEVSEKERTICLVFVSPKGISNNCGSGGWKQPEQVANDIRMFPRTVGIKS